MYGSSRAHTLHGAPTGTYNFPSGPKRRYFQPWCASPGKSSRTTAGSIGRVSAVTPSTPSRRRTREISATYSDPSRYATPFGVSRSSAITFTSSARPSPSPSRTAYTLSSLRVPTYTVPSAPSAIERANGTSAYTLITKPGGSLMSPSCAGPLPLPCPQATIKSPRRPIRITDGIGIPPVYRDPTNQQPGAGPASRARPP